MKDIEKIDIAQEAAVIESDIEKRILTVGIRNLDLDKAKELGVFERLSLSICAFHSTVVAAYMIFSDVQYVIDELRAHRNEISKAVNDFEKAFDKFSRFWSDYYVKGVDEKEVMGDTEALYNQILRWMQIPKNWQLGDKQRLDDDEDIAIRVKHNGKMFTFRNFETSEDVKEINESWCVNKYDPKTHISSCAERDLDKGTAIMVAKRSSANDAESFYTVCKMTEVEKTDKMINPYSVYKNNEKVGNVVKFLK